MGRARSRRGDPAAAGPPPIAARLESLPWPALGESLDQFGWATTGPLLDARECQELAGLYAEPGLFRSRVVMQRHAFGRGEYRYFGYPLPALVADLRASIYPRLAPLADRWNERLDRGMRFPASHRDYLRQCHAAGQGRPTPLLLRYGPGDFNCLHQDLYGPFVFPLQLTILLSDPGRDFAGGEFLLVERRPRAQSRGEVVPLRQGEAVIFAAADRPAAGRRGFHKVAMRHGVSRVRSGERYALGIIFHDAA